MDDNIIPYGDEIIDLKEKEINEAYLDTLDNYIGAKVVVPGQDSVPVLATIKNKKRDQAGNVIGNAN